MSTLELKGSLYDIISNVNDKGLLQQLHEVVSTVVEQNVHKTDFWDELPEAQQKELEQAIEDSKDEKNLIPHEEILNKYKQWLRP